MGESPSFRRLPKGSHQDSTQYRSLTYSNEIELEHECDPDLQFCDSIPNFESILTLVSLPDLDHIFESTFILVPVNLEHEKPISQSHVPLMGNEYET